MRHIRLASIVLAALPCASAQTVTVIQPGIPGLELIGSQSPDFQTALAAVISPELLPQLAAYIPLTVILKNNSPQALAEYMLWWTIDLQPNRRTGGWGAGWISPKSTDAYLQPGAAIAAVPGFVFTRNTSTLPLAAMERRHLLSGFDKAQTVAVLLDSATFASGQNIGPDIHGQLADKAATFSAWRPVDVAVQSQLANGVPFDEIAPSLEQIRDEPTAHTSKATRDYSALVRATEALQLLNLYKRSGAQAVRDRVDQQLQMPQIVVHR